MDTIEKIQLKERISGTLLRLGWLMFIAAFVPALSYVAYAAMAIARFLYLVVLMLVAMATVFLIFLDEGFRNAFKADMVDIMPMVEKIFKGYSALIYVFFIIGLGLAVLSIVLAVKEKNGKVSKKKIISSGFMIVGLILSVIFYLAFKSDVIGG